MIARLLWYAGVFCLFGWIGAHSHGLSVAAPSFAPTADVPNVSRPLHQLARVLGG